jgi:hypothetical protein
MKKDACKPNTPPRTRKAPAKKTTANAPDPSSTVDHLEAASFTSAPPMIGTPNLELRLSFADLAELAAAMDQLEAVVQKVKRRAINQLQDLTPEEIRCADLMNRKWPPEGKPPPELLGSSSAIKNIENEMIDWCKEQDPIEIPPKRDVISRTLKKRGYR